MVTKGEDNFIDTLHREVKIQCSKPKNRNVGQYFIQIPKDIVIELNIEKGDKVVIDVPLKDKTKYSIRLKKLK